MSENAPQTTQPAALTNALPIVTRGMVVSTFMEELTGLVREITQHRVLADDLRAWFAAHPDLSERFGAFQHARAKQRDGARAGKRKRAKSAKR